MAAAQALLILFYTDVAMSCLTRHSQSDCRKYSTPMTWDLISLKPNPHRSGEEDVVVFMRKLTQRSHKKGVDAVQLSVELCPVPLVVGNGSSKKLVPIEKAVFRVVADRLEQKLLFDIANADAALPSVLRGGGLGSLAISELVIWAKQHFPEYAVVTGRVSAVMLNYPNGESLAAACLQSFGFTVARANGGGLQFGAASTEQLKPHVNNAKVEVGSPINWGAQLLQNNLSSAGQLLEQAEEISRVREQLQQVTHSRQSPLPFWSGMLAGLVAGLAIAAFLFSS